jgi:uncharacterized membrane protein
VKALARFVKTTLLGGLLFLLPLIVVLLILKKGMELLDKLVSPIADRIPVESVAGVHARDFLAAIVLVAIAFSAGLVARTGFGRVLSQRLEQRILRKVPGYTLLKGATEGKTGTADTSGVEVALVRFDDNTMLGFIVETQADGTLTVFVPNAPTPAAGNVYYLPEDRVQRLNVPVADAAKVVMRLGVGSKELLAEKAIESRAAPGRGKSGTD